LANQQLYGLFGRKNKKQPLFVRFTKKITFCDVLLLAAIRLG